MTSAMASVTWTAGPFDSPLFLKTIRRRIMGRWRILAFAVAPLVVAALIAISIGVILELPGDYRWIASAVFPVLLLGGRAAIIDFVSTRMQREWLARGVPAEITLT